jgi:hypothetical protein
MTIKGDRIPPIEVKLLVPAKAGPPLFSIVLSKNGYRLSSV